MRSRITLMMLASVVLAVSAFAGSPAHPAGLAVLADEPVPAVINDAATKDMLVGRHKFALQWISWDYFGTADISERDGLLLITAEQRQQDGMDYILLEGFITEVNSRDFKFQGWIETRVSHINGGQPCRRESAVWTFRVTGQRKYWRLKEMANPCEEVVDYIDIFFK